MSANLKRAVKRIKAKLNADYETAQATPTAGPVGTGKAFIAGQVFDGTLTGVTQVVNVGRPAAAQYAPKVGGGVTVVSGGSGSTTTTGSTGSTTALTSIAFLTLEADATLTNERYLAVSDALTKTDGGAGAALTLGLATPGSLSVSSTNVATGAHTHAITSSSNPGAAASLLASDSSGFLTLPKFVASTKMTTPTIDTASGTLSLRPANATAQVVGALRSTYNTTDGGGAVVQGILDSGNSFARAWFGHNAKYDLTADQWNIDNVGANDTSGLLLRNSAAAIDFIFHASTGATSRTMDHSTFTAGAKFTMTSAGRFGVLNTSPTYELDVNGTMRAATSLTTPLITTATNTDLLINPAGTGAVTFQNDQTLRTSSFDSSFPITGWQVNEVSGVSGYSALTIGKIQADELAVRVFVADEVRVDRGDEYWTKSYGIVAESFTTPSSIGGTVPVKFEDSPALAGAIFVNNDWVLIRKLDIDTGITLSNIWGQVATYVNNSDGTQNWTFTLRSGPTSEDVTKGSLAIDFGASGAALIHLSVIDAAGAPYIKMRKWSGANPYTPSNFTTYVQLGELGSTGNAYVTPAGYGLYVRSTNDASRFLLADDNGLQIRGASFKMYNSTLQTVDISSTNGSMRLGTDVSSATTTALDFNASTGNLSITGNLYTSDVYLTEDEGVMINVGSSSTATEKKSITWHEDITNPAVTPILSMYGAVLPGGDTYGLIKSYSATDLSTFYLIADGASANNSQIFMRSQTGTQSIIELTSDEVSMVAALTRTGALTASGNLTVSGGDIAVSGTVDGVDIAAFKSAYDSHSHDSVYLKLAAGQTLTGTLTTRTLQPSATNTYDLGTSSAYYNAAYIRNLHIDTIVGTPTYSHSHDAADIASGTLAFASIPTTWSGALNLDADANAGSSNYVRWTTQTGSKNWDLVARAFDYATTPSQQNDLLLTYFDGTTLYSVFQADSATRVIDFAQTPTVGGTAVSLSTHNHNSAYVPLERTVTAGAGLTGGGALSANITISHLDTSSQASVTNTTTNLIQSVTLDTYGHVTALASADVAALLDDRYVNVTGDTMTGNLTVAKSSARILLDNTDTTQYSSAALVLRNDVQAQDVEWYIFAEKASAGAATGASTLQVRKRNSAGSVALTPIVINVSNDIILNAGYSTGGATYGNVGVKKAPSSSYSLDVSGSMAASTSVLTPTVTTVSGNLSLTSAGGTVAVTGALTGSSTGVFTSTLTAASDTDAINTFGRVRLGYAAATDTASFSHFDNNTSANFALSHNASGATSVNAASGQTVSLQVAGVSQWSVDASRINPRSSVVVDIGDYNRRVRSLYAAELQVETLVAQNVMATIGGRVIVAPTVKLIADLANTGTNTSFNTNLTAYWTLDEASGNRSDSRGTQTLTDTNTVASTSGKQSNAANFVGSSSEKLTRSDNSTLSVGDIDFLVGAWVYPTLNSGGRQTIICKGSAATGEYKLDIDWSNSTVKFAVWNSSGTSTEVASSVIIGVNAWYYIYGWHDSSGNVIGVGINGIENTAAHTTGVRDGTGNFTLGARDTDQFYTGYMDEVALWKNYLPSSHERLWLYNRGSGRTYSEINTQVQSNFDVDGNSLDSGDFVYMAAAPAGIAQIEALRITSSASTITGGYRYTAVRNYDGTGLNNWYAGDAVVNLGGAVGEGYIDLTSTSTIHSHLGPTITIYQRIGTSAWNETTPTVALGNLRSFVDYSAVDASGVAIGNDLTLTPTGGFKGLTADAVNGLRMFSVPIKLYNGATQTVNIDSAGTDIWVGTSSSNKRLQWNGTSLNLNNSAGTAVITFDNSGGSYFAGPMTIGTSGGIYQGSGTFASPTTGLKIWNDTGIGRIGGYNGGTLQWYANTDGKLQFGGGNGFIDADGLTLVTDSVTSHASQSSTSAVQFKRSNGTLVGRLTSYYISAGDDYGLDLYARSPNTEDTYATFGAEQAGTVYGGWAAGAPRVVAYSASTGSDYLRLYANTEIALYRSGSASADLLLNSSGLTSNVDIDLNSNDITDVGSLVTSAAVGTIAVNVVTPASQTQPGVYLQPVNCGSSYGPFIAIDRNNNGSTPSAGWLRLHARTGTAVAIWVDNTGTMRLNTGANPTNANDTSGTVIGSQSSSLDTKDIVGPFTDYDSALTAIVDAPLFDFTYKSGAFGGQRFTGIVTDYAPAFGVDRDEAHPAGKSLNEITAHGYTFAAIKALHSRIEQLENQVRELTTC